MKSAPLWRQWKSRTAFVLAAAGSAVGLGNLWRFPYVTGAYGGGAFVVLYLVIVAAIGYPLMVTEMALGRKTHKNPFDTFTDLAPKTPWWVVGSLSILAGFVILTFYSVVAGWSIAFFFKTLSGTLPLGTDFTQVFVDHISHPVVPLVWHGVFMVVTMGILASGSNRIFDPVMRFLMPALLAILLMLVLRSLTLPGAWTGLAFYLTPDLGRLTIRSLNTAIGQAFFSLSLGMGCMITYGSYMSDREEIPDNAAWVVGLDTAIALLAGLAIFPAVFALGIPADSGAGLTFIALPAVFAHMPAGILFGSLFFLLLTVAALTSAVSLLEVVVLWLVDEQHMELKRASLFVCLLVFLVGIPVSLSEGLMDNVMVLDTNFFGFMEFLMDYLLLPGGGLLTAVYAGHVWSALRTREEANLTTGRIRLGAWFEVLLKWVIPAVIFLVMVMGFYDRLFS